MPDVAPMSEKVAALRRLIAEVGVVSHSQLAERWGVSRQAVRDFMDHEDAPRPLFPNGTRYYALPEAEAFRTRRLRLADAGRRRNG